jgi:transposase
MPRFDGLNDDQFAMLEPFLPKPPARKKPGYRPTPPRKVLNTILWLLFSGARWCDVPTGQAFASRAAAWRWFDRWRHDGTLWDILNGLREMASMANLIDWQRLIVDGSFSPNQRPRPRRLPRPQGQGLHHSSPH